MTKIDFFPTALAMGSLNQCKALGGVFGLTSGQRFE